MRWLASGGHLYQIFFTLGLVLIVQEAIVFIWGPDPTSVDVPAAFAGGAPLSVVSLPHYRLFLVFAATVVIGALWLGSQRTKAGAIIRAYGTWRRPKICKPKFPN